MGLVPKQRSIASNMAEYTRKDIHLTSTGVGHHYRPGYYFPSSNFKTVTGEPLPPTLALQDEIPRDEHFKTTTGIVHDNKHSGGPYGNQDVRYKKAPGHWKVNYVKDLHEKLGAGGHRRPLTMGNQTSETHDEFRAQPGITTQGDFAPNPQGFLLHNHHTDGPSKQIYPTTKNEKLKGRPFFVRDKGVHNLNDMYLTTNNKEHRAYKPKELAGYAKKDVPTYWECEEYPKAWGHGLTHNPLPKDSVPRERPPMRDQTWFRTETKIRRLPNRLVPVPHTGLKSLQNESYQQPSDVKMREIYYCPVDVPYTLPAPGSKSAYAAPSMYKSEYQSYGCAKPITV